MKEKRFGLNDRAAVLLALGLLLAAGLFALFWPHGDFSDTERRYRSAAPSVPSLTAWKTDRETENWLSDRIPFRSVLVGTDSLFQSASGYLVTNRTLEAASKVKVHDRSGFDGNQIYIDAKVKDGVYKYSAGL